MSYEGTLQVYRALPVEVTELLPMLISKYSGTNNDEAFAEAVAHHFADRGLCLLPGHHSPTFDRAPARSVARQSADASGAHILRGKPSRGRGRRSRLSGILRRPRVSRHRQRAHEKAPRDRSGALFVVLNQPGQASLRLVGLPFRGPG